MSCTPAAWGVMSAARWARLAAFTVSIDACVPLVGVLTTAWREPTLMVDESPAAADTVSAMVMQAKRAIDIRSLLGELTQEQLVMLEHTNCA